MMGAVAQTSDNRNTVGRTILQQLGGQRFIAMTGANNFVYGANSLAMSVPRARYEDHLVTTVRVTLDPSDTYTVQALRFDRRTFQVTVVAKREDVYFDMLPEIFTRLTGLETKL